jgi:hypothetical protein
VKQGPLLAFVLLAPLAALDVSLARAAISLGGVSHSGAVLLAGVTLVLLVAIAITIVVRDGSRLRVAILMAVGVGIAGGLAAGIPAARFYLDSGLLASHTLKG